MGFRYEFDDTSSFFGIFMAIFVLIFVIVIGIFVFAIVRGVRQWNKNNHSPRLTVNAQVVSKRMDITHHHHGAGSGHVMHTSSSTWYYVTFQVESGDRIELPVNGFQYGMLAEGDFGKLTFQGTRYIDFVRQ